VRSDLLDQTVTIIIVLSVVLILAGSASYDSKKMLTLSLIGFLLCFFITILYYGALLYFNVKSVNY